MQGVRRYQSFLWSCPSPRLHRISFAQFTRIVKLLCNPAFVDSPCHPSRKHHTRVQEGEAALQATGRIGAESGPGDKVPEILPALLSRTSVFRAAEHDTSTSIDKKLYNV